MMLLLVSACGYAAPMSGNTNSIAPIAVTITITKPSMVKSDDRMEWKLRCTRRLGRDSGERMRPACWWRRPASTIFLIGCTTVTRRQVRFGGTPKPARETPALPGSLLRNSSGFRPAYAECADSALVAFRQGGRLVCIGHKRAVEKRGRVEREPRGRAGVAGRCSRSNPRRARLR